MGTGVHAVMGTGGAPEGVLTAAALRCLGGEIQARLRFRNDEERARAERMGTATRTASTRPTTSRRARRSVLRDRRHEGDLLKGVSSSAVAPGPTRS